MKLLVDGNAVIWYAEDARPLADTARAAIESPANEKHVSVATIWELTIKAKTGKLRFSPDLRDRLRAAGFLELNISGDQAVQAAQLPLLHRDPFDRLLVAQAQLEGMTIVTSDSVIAHYDVPVIPAG
ncbi:MAG: type II toxin-antitoxin system VapC family toxin [Solirubrobacterales bacterium]